MTHTRTRKRTGFTLVELLVVIGIIAVLISILLPSLSRARRQAKAAVCLANLRNFGNSVAMYMAQNRGRLVFGSAYEPTASYNGENGTVSRLWYRKVFYGASGTRVVTMGEGTWKSYGVSGKVAVCPGLGDVGLPVAGLEGVYKPGDPALTLAGYIGYGINPSLTSVSRGVAFIKRSEELAVIGDVALFKFTRLYDDQNSFLSNRDTTTSKPQAPTFHGRHLGQGGVLWLDGHASLVNPILPPDSFTLTFTSDEYRKRNLGYLARSAEDMTDGSVRLSNYYFDLNH